MSSDFNRVFLLPQVLRQGCRPSRLSTLQTPQVFRQGCRLLRFSTRLQTPQVFDRAADSQDFRQGCRTFDKAAGLSTRLQTPRDFRQGCRLHGTFDKAADS